MEKKIITISREFGSGGRTIGRMVAERLGIPFYDKELVDQIALESGFAPKFVEEHGEHSPGKSFLSYVFAPQGVPGVMNGLSTADFLWNVQCGVILQLAEKGPCVIVGRNADYILKDRSDVMDVYIHAETEFKADRIVRLYGESEKSPMTRLQEKDKRRLCKLGGLECNRTNLYPTLTAVNRCKELSCNQKCNCNYNDNPQIFSVFMIIRSFAIN